MFRKSVDELSAARSLAGAGSLPQWIDAQSKTLSKLQKENQQLKTKLALEVAAANRMTIASRSPARR